MGLKNEIKLKENQHIIFKINSKIAMDKELKKNKISLKVVWKFYGRGQRKKEKEGWKLK